MEEQLYRSSSFSLTKFLIPFRDLLELIAKYVCFFLIDSIPKISTPIIMKEAPHVSQKPFDCIIGYNCVGGDIFVLLMSQKNNQKLIRKYVA
jgi:hypothetical protein